MLNYSQNKSINITHDKLENLADSPLLRKDWILYFFRSYNNFNFFYFPFSVKTRMEIFVGFTFIESPQKYLTPLTILIFIRSTTSTDQFCNTLNILLCLYYIYYLIILERIFLLEYQKIMHLTPRS